jgi:hypothetical protein
LLMALLVWRFLPEPGHDLIPSTQEEKNEPAPATASGTHV